MGNNVTYKEYPFFGTDRITSNFERCDLDGKVRTGQVKRTWEPAYRYGVNSGESVIRAVK